MMANDTIKDLHTKYLNESQIWKDKVLDKLTKQIFKIHKEQVHTLANKSPSASASASASVSDGHDTPALLDLHLEWQIAFSLCKHQQKE